MTLDEQMKELCSTSLAPVVAAFARYIHKPAKQHYEVRVMQAAFRRANKLYEYLREQ